MPEVPTHAIYRNARIRGMKSRLMEREALDDLLDQGELSILIEVLLNSEYKEEMAEALSRYDGADAVEEAVSRNLAATFERIQTFSNSEQGSLTRLLLARWDLVTVKALLRNHIQHSGSELDTRTVSPGPNLPSALVRDLALRDSLESLLQGLTAWDGQLCGGLYREFLKGGPDVPLRALEDALDRGYLIEGIQRLAAAPDEDSRMLLRLLRMTVDTINLRLILRNKVWKPRAEDVIAWLLPEGTLSWSTLLAMATAKNVEDAVVLLDTTVYRELVEGLYGFLQTRRFAPLERMFEHLLLNELKRMARRQVLGFGVVMHYAWLKHNEVVNLRLIARGEARHLPPGRVREELLYA
jgi:V/A-type H+/Na+-transporting ATPase subunit C